MLPAFLFSWRYAISEDANFKKVHGLFLSSCSALQVSALWRRKTLRQEERLHALQRLWKKFLYCNGSGHTGALSTMSCKKACCMISNLNSKGAIPMKQFALALLVVLFSGVVSAQNMTSDTSQINFNPNGPLAPGQFTSVVTTWTAAVNGVKITAGGPPASSIPICVQGTASLNTFVISSGEANVNNNMYVGQRVTFSDGSNQLVTSFSQNVSLGFPAPVPPLAVSACWIGGEYASEEDDVVILNLNCPTSGMMAGQQCQMKVTLTADPDDRECDLNWPLVAYPGIGCQGVVNFRIWNPATPGLYAISTIPYTYSYFNPTPQINISPTALAFPETSISGIAEGATPPTMQSVFMNTDDAPITLSLEAVGAAYTQTNDCPPTLLSLQSCDVTVTFIPTIVGSNPGYISVTDNASNSAKKITLNGIGIK
jgi:hypothetical protein